MSTHRQGQRSAPTRTLWRWLRWGVLLFCGLWLACAPPNGDCVQCKQGTRRCTPDGKALTVCQHQQSTGCWQFILRKCLSGQTCAVRGGVASCGLAQSCTTSCTPGQKRCNNKDIELCLTNPLTTCNEWTTDKICPLGQSCDATTFTCGSGGSCQPKTPQAEKRCVGNVIHWFDDCGNQGAQIQTCSAGQSCQNGTCQGAGGCQSTNPQAEKRCVGNVLHWFDNCGKQGAIFRKCVQGQQCRSGKCQNSACQPTNPQASKRCVGNALYWVDDCGKQGVLFQQCGQGQKCQGTACVGSCKPTNPQASKRCVGSDIYWFDDCNKKGTLVSRCNPPAQCKNAKCESCLSGNHQCAANASQCSGNSISTCEVDQSTGCRKWNQPFPCPSGMLCQAGACIKDNTPPPQQCKVGIAGTCSNNSDCCTGQSCQRALFIKGCGPCRSDSDCPKAGGVLPTKCCSLFGKRICALSCSLP